MDAFVAAGYTGETLRLLNRCRLYLRVAVLSEVIDGGGSKLRAQMVAGTTPMAKSQYVWPNQGKTPAKSWKIWKESMNGLTERGRLR